MIYYWINWLGLVKDIIDYDYLYELEKMGYFVWFKVDKDY